MLWVLDAQYRPSLCMAGPAVRAIRLELLVVDDRAGDWPVRRDPAVILAEPPVRWSRVVARAGEILASPRMQTYPVLYPFFKGTFYRQNHAYR
jgi:hypothetical protein